MRNTALLLLIGLHLAAACYGQPNNESSQTTEPINGPRIAWDYRSLRPIAAAGGYARVKILRDGHYIALYETSRGTMLRKSGDKGVTWGEEQLVFEGHACKGNQGATTWIHIANPEFLELANGDWIYGVNYRPQKNDITPYAVAIRRSSDKGTIWTEPQVLYEAGSDAENGCWEPAFLQLADGRVQLYFANEAPFTTSEEQEIALLESRDNGVTWSPQPKRVSFRAGHRDGMPIPLLLNDTIAVAIEDDCDGRLKPYIVRTSVLDNWAQPIAADSPHRNRALKEELPRSTYMGAPYLVYSPEGYTLLGYQSMRNRDGEWTRSIPEVAIGDAQARNFAHATTPFHLTESESGLWNALVMEDAKTVLLISSIQSQTGQRPWMIRGHLLDETIVPTRSVTLDGKIATSEWGDKLPFFVGHRSNNHLQAAIACDPKRLYLVARLTGNEVTESPNKGGVVFLIATENSCAPQPEKGTYRITCTPSGTSRIEEGRKGQWIELSPKEIRVASSPAAGSKNREIEISIPRRKYRIASDTIRFGIVRISAEGKHEPLVETSEQLPYTWYPLLLPKR